MFNHSVYSFCWKIGLNVAYWGWILIKQLVASNSSSSSCCSSSSSSSNRLIEVVNVNYLAHFPGATSNVPELACVCMGIYSFICKPLAQSHRERFSPTIYYAIFSAVTHCILVFTLLNLNIPKGWKAASTCLPRGITLNYGINVRGLFEALNLTSSACLKI
jgi:hypothetical protein